MTIDLEVLRALANRPTRARWRAEYMGWRFGWANVDAADGLVTVSMTFTCVCGRAELARIAFQCPPGEGWRYTDGSVDAGLIRHLDIAAGLERAGSFSRDHLLADGYTPQQCDEIARLAWEFDTIVDPDHELDRRLSRLAGRRHPGPSGDDPKRAAHVVP